MTKYLFLAGFILQIFGFLLVTVCLVNGLRLGDYGKIELMQFLSGALFFYLGNWTKKLSQR